jgi:hypothetical protein
MVDGMSNPKLPNVRERHQVVEDLIQVLPRNRTQRESDEIRARTTDGRARSQGCLVIVGAVYDEHDGHD